MNHRHDRRYLTSDYELPKWPMYRDDSYPDGMGMRDQAGEVDIPLSQPSGHYPAREEAGYDDGYGSYEPGASRNARSSRYGRHSVSSERSPRSEPHRYGQNPAYTDPHRRDYAYDSPDLGLFGIERYSAARYGPHGDNRYLPGPGSNDGYRHYPDQSSGSSHRGKGPRGYTRSDERICDELYDQLTNSPEIDASDIEIVVQNGVVSLSGRVPHRRMKHDAEDCADRISGVKDVDNRIRVKRNDDDADISGSSPAA